MSSTFKSLASKLKPFVKPSRKRYRYLRDAALMALFAFALLSYQQRNMISGEAPPLSAITTQGQPIALKQGEVTLIYFWGTWCPICRVTSPMVNSVAGDHKVISIAVASGTDDEINQFMTEHHYQFDVIGDEEALHQAWGASVFPAIYIVDKQGLIRFKTSGATSSWGMRLRLLLAAW
ncbi:protein disulfide oxidoreductase [Shewanella insulae]|uniref:protein disulfide oxidoreductase n=1 Tax=Shewanella insulae TaxID=2681496 RepID=UPI001EFEC0D9|nr:protein disulfide oxidoreductase [Shewanella insulae]MCG9757287.1 protein disulfide oxidoreductase [Shewanella insulae]